MGLYGLTQLKSSSAVALLVFLFVSFFFLCVFYSCIDVHYFLACYLVAP